MYLSTNSIYSTFNSQLAKEEKNDCVVRSLATAASVTYDIAHKFCNEVFGRENKKGTSNLAITTQMLKLDGSELKIGNNTFDVKVLGKSNTKNRYKVKGEIIWRQKTLKSFIADHPKGTYMVMVAKHALTVKDGELLDWDSNKFLPTRKVQAAYKLTPKKVEGLQLSLF